MTKAQLNQLTLEQLRELNEQVVKAIKAKRKDIIAHSKEVSAMLRQQALEIQALHQILGYEGIEVGQDYLDECVAELRKAQEK